MLRSWCQNNYLLSNTTKTNTWLWTSEKNSQNNRSMSIQMSERLSV